MTPMTPFDFDVGKNFAMDLCPQDTDFVINIDLDEELLPSFKTVIDQIEPQTDHVLHLYQPDGKIKRYREEYRLHKRHGYRWRLPIHEELYPVIGKENLQRIDEVLLTQWPNPRRKHTWCAKLFEAVNRFPNEPRLLMLAGRDFYFDEQYADSLEYFTRFIGCKWNDFEKSYAYTMMGRCYQKLGDKEREMECYEKAVKAAPRRESVVTLANAYLSRGQYGDALLAAEYALGVKQGKFAANNDPGAWSFKPYEIASIAAYRMRDLESAIEYAELALAETTEEVDKNRISEHLEISKKKREELLEFESLTA